MSKGLCIKQHILIKHHSTVLHTNIRRKVFVFKRQSCNKLLAQTTYGVYLKDRLKCIEVLTVSTRTVIFREGLWIKKVNGSATAFFPENLHQV